jgi:hypothetical protein
MKKFSRLGDCILPDYVSCHQSAASVFLAGRRSLLRGGKEGRRGEEEEDEGEEDEGRGKGEREGGGTVSKVSISLFILLISEVISPILALISCT